VKNRYTTSEQFCQDLLNIDIKDAKALVGIIMALGSEREADSPTALSESPFFQYHYSIISKVMKQMGLQCNGAESLEFRSGLRQLVMAYAPRQDTHKFSSDLTTIRKGDSPKLAERGFVQIPNNRIYDNKPIDVGYYVSYVNLGLYDWAHPLAWSLPLDCQRVGVDEDKMGVAVRQLSELLEDPALPFGTSAKVVNAADSGYALAKYVCPLINSFDNLLLLVRLRYGIKVYKPYQGEQSPRGRNKDYDHRPLYLQTENRRRCFNPKTKTYFVKEQSPIFDQPPDQQDTYQSVTARGRLIIVELYRWNDLLMRGSREHYMGDKPFDLIGVRFVDKETGQLLFKREMFIALWGKQRREYSLKEAQLDYRHRYDIEPHNRFAKQALLADKYQTPDVSHLDGWLWTVLLTFWLLYAACKETKVVVKPWEKYLSIVRQMQNSENPMSPTMTRRGTKALFSTFDLKPYKPQESKNGVGRKKGDRQTTRINHPPRRKNVNTAKNEPLFEDSS